MLWTAVMSCSLLCSVFTSIEAGSEMICQDVQAKYDRLVIEKDLMEKNLTGLQTKYDRLVIEKDLMEKNLTDKDEKLQNLEVKYRCSDVMKTYKVDVTLDPETAGPFLILSGDGKQVREGHTWRDVPENPKRFKYEQAVLGKEGFSSGRFYYEVQVKDKTRWYLGVARESINRKRVFSSGDGLWAVGLNEAQYKAVAAGPYVLLSLSQQPQKVGVFVDYEQGEVSFYDVDHRSHIYSFTGQTFTEKLYPIFHHGPNMFSSNGDAPMVITPVE